MEDTRHTRQEASNKPDSGKETTWNAGEPKLYTETLTIIHERKENSIFLSDFEGKVPIEQVSEEFATLVQMGFVDCEPLDESLLLHPQRKNKQYQIVASSPIDMSEFGTVSTHHEFNKEWAMTVLSLATGKEQVSASDLNNYPTVSKAASILNHLSSSGWVQELDAEEEAWKRGQKMKELAEIINRTR